MILYISFIQITVTEIPTPEGPKQQITKKRTIKKKQGDKEQIIEVLTVEDEGEEPETSITVEEIQPVESTSEEPLVEEQPKLKKKKTVKKVKNLDKNDEENLVQKLIDEDIPSFEPETKTIKKKKPKKATTADEELLESTVLDEEGTDINVMAEANVLLKSLLNYKKIDESLPLPEQQDELEEDLPDDADKTTKKKVKRKIIKKPKQKKGTDDESPDMPDSAEVPVEEQEIIELAPMPIIRKQQKPTKPVTCTVEDLPKVLAQLRKATSKKKDAKPSEENVINFRLKSRITPMEYPPAVVHLKITDIKTVRGKGELSRNIEEALKVLKRRKVKKFKPTEYEKESLEKADSELSESSEKSEDLDSETKSKYQRQAKDAPVDELHKGPLKLGKGKHKPQIDESPEQVKLKPVKKKDKPSDEVDEADGQLGKATIVPSDEQNVDTQFNLEPIPPFDSTPIDRDLEEYEKPDEMPSDLDDNDETKPKHKRKKKKKPEAEETEHKIVKGVPKPQEIPSDDEVNFKIKQKPQPDTSAEDVVLKPFEKPVDEKTTDESGKSKPKPKKKSSKKKESPDDEHPTTATIDDDSPVINITELPEDTEHKHTDTKHKIHPPHFEQITQIDEPGKI